MNTAHTQSFNFIRLLKGYQNSDDSLKEKGVIVSVGGAPYNVFELKAADVSIAKIARSSSREARYNGDTEKPYYVAQHVVVGAEALLLMGRPDLAKIYMLHDGSEKILGDMSKPIKNLLPDYEKLQDEFDKFIASVYDLEYPFPPEIKMIDKNSAQLEMTFMMHTYMHTDYWTSEVAEARFHETWNKINFILETYYASPVAQIQ